MKKSNIQATVLEKCGITVDVIRALKTKGLLIPESIKPVERPFRSPSEEWFYFIADRFTPSLSRAEMVVFRTCPHLLSLQILKAVDCLFDVSCTLYVALQEAKKNLKDEEAIAAILAILRIFHGCLDYNYLKYDRHLEYHEYKESPVGFYWDKLNEMCCKAARSTNVQDTEEWVQKKLLEIISGPRRILTTSEYALCCKQVYGELKMKFQNVDTFSPTDILRELKEKSPEYLEIVIKYSEHFYRTPEEFLHDCIAAKETNPYEDIRRSKRISISAIEDVKSRLTMNDADEFERIVEIVEEFLAVQELEGLIAYGSKPNIKSRIFDTLIGGYDQLRDLLLSSDLKYVTPRYKRTVEELLKGEDVPSKFVADRKLTVEGECFFVEDVRRIFFEEIKRWTNAPSKI